MTMKLMTAWKKGKEKKIMIFVSLPYINVSPQVTQLKKKKIAALPKKREKLVLAGFLYI